jgi:hypothetical protein
MVALAKRLDRVYVPGSSVAKVAKKVPPGRFNAQAAIQGAVQRRSGQRVTARPFIERRVTHSPKAALKIAFLGDISGSMGGLAESLAVSRWMVSEAGYRVNAKVGAILFGQEVYPVQRPGKRTNEIVVYPCTENWEAGATAWAMLDESMTFIKDKSSARIVVWFTDFEFVRATQATAAFAAMQEMQRAGVNVVAVVPSEDDEVNAAHLGVTNVVVVNRYDAVATANKIGETILDAVRGAR